MSRLQIGVLILLAIVLVSCFVFLASAIVTNERAEDRARACINTCRLDVAPETCYLTCMDSP